MKISKKKIQEINMISHTDALLKEIYPKNTIAGTHWTDTPPDMWDKDAVQYWNILNELEMRLKRDILRALGVNEEHESNTWSQRASEE